MVTVFRHWHSILSVILNIVCELYTVCWRSIVASFFCMQATAVVRANLANHILVSHTTSSVAVMVCPPVVAPAQGRCIFELDFFLITFVTAVQCCM